MTVRRHHFWFAVKIYILRPGDEDIQQEVIPHTSVQTAKKEKERKKQRQKIGDKNR